MIIAYITSAAPIVVRLQHHASIASSIMLGFYGTYIIMGKATIEFRNGSKARGHRRCDDSYRRTDAGIAHIPFIVPDRLNKPAGPPHRRTGQPGNTFPVYTMTAVSSAANALLCTSFQAASVISPRPVRSPSCPTQVLLSGHPISAPRVRLK